MYGEGIELTSFFIWERGEESLQKFTNKLNSFHATIKFTAKWSFLN